jgi:hypothetical protein
MLRAARIWVLLSLFALFLSVPAHAQVQNGQIQGVVKSDADGRPMAGVTVTVSGPSLQEDQVEVTGRDGRYTITQLPSGDDYTVRFYLGDTIVERPGVRVAQNKTLTVSVLMPMKKMTKEVKVIRERAPNVDTATAQAGVEINEEVLRATAVRGRTFESVLSLAPGTVDPPRGQGGDIGVSISGSTGNENNYIVDGLNTADPNSGILATELHQYFIKEIDVITGGYQAEYGRATGGIVSVVTKNGGNEFHGSVFGSITPFQLTPNTVGRLGEALAVRRKPDDLVYDFGFDLGGYIVKNRVWFYVGFAPTTTVDSNDVAVRSRVQDPNNPGQPELLSNYQCPSYLSSSALCRGTSSLALATQELPAYTQHLDETKRLYNGIVKLQFNINADHNITLGYIASPTTFDGYSTLSPLQYSNFSDFHYTEVDQIHDVMARYVGKLFDRRLQLDVMYGFHYQSSDQEPDKANSPIYVYYTDPSNPYSLADFQPIPECQRQANGFNPCPVTNYRRNGFGDYESLTVQRHQLLAAATAYLNFIGTHAIKLGFDFEHLDELHTRQYSGTDIDPNNPYSGHRYYQTSADGSQFQNFAEYFTYNADGTPERLNSFTAHTYTNNYALYLRDSWNISKLPGLVINAGIRYEIQELFAVDGSRQIFIPDDIAPRVGAVWDFTQKGLSKLYVNYARFYESIPLTINDRQFSGEGTITGALTSDCPRQALQPNGRALPYAGSQPGTPCTLSGPNDNYNAGQYGTVMPGLKGQYVDEVVAGLNYDVGWDVVVGIGYIYRSLGNIIEDVSVDGGTTFLIANPGTQPDPQQIAAMQSHITQLQTSGASSNEIQAAQSQLEVYRSLGLFPKAQRQYHALVLTVSKRMSNRISILANYTYSRTFGNYPGTYDATSDENLPNFSSNYDLTHLLANKNGPLPTDRPNNLKLLGTYSQPLPRGGRMTFGLTFSAFSGRPINVLGADAIYGPSYVFILPRGAGGRTPMVTQFDLHVGYDQPFSKRITLSVFVDVINLFNQQQVTNVDDDYTYSSVLPILNGQPSDLVHLRSYDGRPAVINPNYGQPTAYQEPLYMRFGARLSF